MTPLPRAPTDRQVEVLTFVRDYTNEHKYAPSLRDIRDHFNLGGTNGVNDHLRALQRKGLIDRDEAKSRAIVVTARGHALLEGRPFVPAPSVESTLRQRIDAIDAELCVQRAAIAHLVSVLATTSASTKGEP